MYVKIIFIILIIIILCYIINNYILLTNDIKLIYDKFNRLNDDHIKLIKLVNSNTTNLNSKNYDCSKIFKESDDSECYVNQLTDLDKSIICYQSKSGDQQLVQVEQALSAINDIDQSRNIQDDEKSSLALPLGSFVDAFLKKCLYNDDQDHIYYPEQKYDSERIPESEQVIINESDSLTQNNKSNVITTNFDKDSITSNKSKNNYENNTIRTMNNDLILKDIIKDDITRKKKISNIIGSIEKIKSIDNLKLINNI